MPRRRHRRLHRSGSAAVPERLEPRLALSVAPGLVPVGGQPTGGLSGKIVYTSAGHGWQWSTVLDRFATDRGNLLSLVEDFGNQDQFSLYVDEVFRAGATVVPMRPVGRQVNEVVLDNDSPDVVWSGSWSTSTTGIRWYDDDSGAVADTARYRFATVNSSTETAVATYAPTIPAAGLYPVYAWSSSGSNRTTQTYRINHTGGSTEVKVDHRMVGNGWVYLGTYHFAAGRSPVDGSVQISNLSSGGGSVVIADAIRFGNGMGDVPSGADGIGASTGSVSGYPREDENSLHWLWRGVGQGTSFSSPSAVIGTSNVSAPIMMAAEMNADTNPYGASVYVGFHSNATTGDPATATGRGAHPRGGRRDDAAPLEKAGSVRATAAVRLVVGLTLAVVGIGARADNEAWVAPPQLRAGDRVALVAPCGIPDLVAVEAFATSLEAMGFEVIRDPMLAERRHRYLAGHDEHRADELNRAFRDPTVRGVFVVRGGFGLTRILDVLDYDALRRNPKVVSGYSDVTALHLGIARKARMITFHAPMAGAVKAVANPTSFADRSFQEMLFQSPTLAPRRLSVPEGATVTTVTGGRCEGRLIGGNLSLVCATLGTPYAIEPEGAVLLIEDIDERPYRMDRMMSHLRLAGVLDAVAGVVIGRFKGEDAEEEELVREIVIEYCQPLGCPVIADFPCGHVADNATLPLGARVALDADAGTLTVLEPTCLPRPPAGP